MSFAGEGRLRDSARNHGRHAGTNRALARLAALFPVALPAALFAALAGCTVNPEMAGQAFVAPGRYALYDCQQLATEKTGVSKREAELRNLIGKAETGFGGSLVAEAAYGTDYATERQKLQAINQAEVQNRCGESAR
jgi:hypothetical protein